MNRETAKELLPIITAFAEGATIQSCSGSVNCRGLEWKDDDDPPFDDAAFDFRVKREPRVVMVVYPADGGKPYVLEDGDVAKSTGIAYMFREVME